MSRWEQQQPQQGPPPRAPHGFCRLQLVAHRDPRFRISLFCLIGSVAFLFHVFAAAVGGRVTADAGDGGRAVRRRDGNDRAALRSPRGFCRMWVRGHTRQKQFNR